MVDTGAKEGQTSLRFFQSVGAQKERPPREEEARGCAEDKPSDDAKAIEQDLQCGCYDREASAGCVYHRSHRSGRGSWAAGRVFWLIQK